MSLIKNQHNRVRMCELAETVIPVTCWTLTAITIVGMSMFILWMELPLWLCALIIEFDVLFQVCITNFALKLVEQRIDAFEHEERVKLKHYIKRHVRLGGKI